MRNILHNFMTQVVPDLVSNSFIDNEFGLQFELGCYLRRNGYNVYFED